MGLALSTLSNEISGELYVEVLIAAVQPQPLAKSYHALCAGADVAKACEFVRQAAAQGADLAIFPEMYPFVGENEMMEAAREARIHVICGLCEPEGNRWYNSITVIDPWGRVLGRQRKQFLTDVEVERGALSGDRYEPVLLDIPYRGTLSVGVVSGTDFTYFGRGGDLKRQGVDILVVPAWFEAMAQAFPCTVLSRHLELALPVLGVNIARTEATIWERGDCGGGGGGCSALSVPPHVRTRLDFYRWLHDEPDRTDRLGRFMTVLGESETVALIRVDIEAARLFPGYFCGE